MVIDQYEVYLVNLDPSIGHEIKKTRPCLVISPDEMINGSWDKVSHKLQESIYEGDNFKANVASILGLRFLNYCNRHLGTDRAPSNLVEQRITDLLTSETQLFSKDILYHIVKVLCKQHVAKTNKWFLNKHIREIAL